MAKKRRGSSLKESPKSAAAEAPHGLPLAVVWVSIFGAALLAYWPAVEGGLVYDDVLHLTRPELQSLHGLWRIWFDLGATQQYYPLLHSAFWMEYRLWGSAVLGYHLTNVFLHALAACLVVMIVRRLALPGAWLAGMIFALHPVCVESVAWISEQKSTLSAVFCLGAALAYLHFDQTRRQSRYWLAFGLFVLALATKTVTATLPAALLVLFWWRRGRLEWKRDVLPLVPWFAVAVPAGLFTAWVERVYTGAQGADFQLTALQRVWLAGRVIWFYAVKLVWPANLMLNYPRWEIDPRVWWQALFPAGVLAVGACLGLAARRRRGPLAAFLIFGGTLFPVLGFLNVYPFRYSYVADHFAYLASLAIIVPAAALSAAARRFRLAKAAAAVTVAALLAVLGACTWRQSGFYRDAETLFREAAARNPSSWMAHDNLGNALARQPGRLAEAMSEFAEAARIKPDLAEAHANLGNALMQTPGRLPEAIVECETAVRLDPNRAEAHADLGSALLRTPGRLTDAIRELEIAVRLRPDLVEARNDLGNGLMQMPGRLPDAIAQYQEVVRLRPEIAELHANLGNALANLPDRLADAAAEYQAALRINPGLIQARYNLAAVLSHLPGRLPDAIAEYQAALRLNPELTPPTREIAAALAGAARR